MGVPNYQRSLPEDIAAIRQELAAVQIALRTQRRPARMPIVSETSSRDLALADAGCVLQMNSSSPLTLTLPSGTGITIGAYGRVAQWGSGLLSIAAAGGVTIRSRFGAGTHQALARYGRIEWTKTAANEYWLAGDLTA